MWRERFSAHNTPSRSPAPQPSSRASLQVDRGSPAPRAPSFSNLSDRSSTSLASSAKPTPNAGPGLKNRVDVAPPADVEDPLTALERLVGSALEKTRTVTGSQRPEKLVTSVDFGGKSLQAFTDVVNVPASAPTAPPTEPSSVEECTSAMPDLILYADAHAAGSRSETEGWIPRSSQEHIGKELPY